MPDDLKPCPYCGRRPRVYHGASKGRYGDSVECDADDCPAPDDRPIWPYVTWDEAVKRWNDHAAGKAA